MFPRFQRWFGCLGMTGVMVLGLLAGSGRLAVAQSPAPLKTNSLPAGGVYVIGTNSILDPEYGLGSWIWIEPRKNRQTCRFWKAFDIPKGTVVTNAVLRMTADDSYELFLDGRRIGRGGEWSNLNEYEIPDLLPPGRHVLGIEAFNDALVAGVILGLRIQMANGQVMEIASDASWRLAPKSDMQHWMHRTRAPIEWTNTKTVGRVTRSAWSQTPFNIVKVGNIKATPIPIWEKQWFQVSVMSAGGVAVVVIIYLLSQLATQSRAQRFLQRERARIARDIHDDVGARLTQLVLLGERARREAAPDESTRSQFDQVCVRSREILSAMDEVVWLVNSRHDTVQDFEAYVCSYAESFLQATPIRCRLDVAVDSSTAAFDLAIRRNLFLAIKEALNNAVKYSEATELFLRIHPTAEKMAVVVEDNGRGFSLAEANPQRHGLANMKQRIAEVGGECRITSEPGKGCRVEFCTPLLHARKSRWRWWRGGWQGRQETAAQLDRAQEVAAHTMGQVSKT